MANAILTNKAAASLIAKSAAAILHDKLQFLKSIDKEDPALFNNGFNGYQAGDTIKIQKPAQFTVSTGSALSAQDVAETSVSLAVTTQKHIDVNFTSAEIATDLDVKKWAKHILDPAMARLASEVESDVLSTVYYQTWNAVGTAGTAPNSLATYLAANRKLDENLAPMDDERFVLVNPEANAATVDALKGLFQSSDEVSKQYKMGYMGQAAGFSFLRNSLLPNHTNGTMAGAASALTNGATQTGSTLAIDGMTGSATIKKGTVFTIAGVYRVHPETKATQSDLQQFVVTADVTLSGGAGNLSISPAITTSGATQTVSTSAADNSAITWFDSAASSVRAQNLAYHKSAVRFCSVPLVMPKGVDFAAQETIDGLTVRVIRQYDIANDKLPMRIDILYGSAVVRPEHLVRITG
jgi:hypothetical protein